MADEYFESEILPVTKTLKQLLIDAEFDDVRFYGERISSGKKTFLANDRLTCRYHDVSISVSVAEATATFAIDTHGSDHGQVLLGTIVIDGAESLQPVRKFVDDFLSFGVVVDEFGDRIIAVHGADDDASLRNLTHAVCNGEVVIRSISHSHIALVCKSCHLRVPVAGAPHTFGDLRKLFKRFNP